MRKAIHLPLGFLKLGEFPLLLILILTITRHAVRTCMIYVYTRVYTCVRVFWLIFTHLRLYECPCAKNTTRKYTHSDNYI